MAVEYCPPTSPDNPQSRVMSPRISFSHDLNQYDVVPVEPHIPLSPSSLSASASFNFHTLHLSPPSSAADELFSNGVLLPIQTKPPTQTDSPTPKTVEEQSKNRKPSNSASNTSSFWKFRRSRSCNCGSIYAGALCPILLPRSRSTGSNSSSKKPLVPKEGVNGIKHRSSYQKPPLNKGYGSNSGAGFRVSPVLNVSSANLFGLGSLFSSIGRGGDKCNRKKLAD